MWEIRRIECEEPNIYRADLVDPDGIGWSTRFRVSEVTLAGKRELLINSTLQAWDIPSPANKAFHAVHKAVTAFHYAAEGLRDVMPRTQAY
ncbi:hypothetical protein [Hamadaea tsunoensis]|uniref:hypothetical protein n=1 Tax=Hamadaea tsunoensis TaxID=53368 RepID=UPI0004810D3A|nr:hypothetical protein [Hamadaea tsunoensis]